MIELRRTRLSERLQRLIQVEHGQDMTEYAMLVTVIAIVVISAAIVFHTQLSSWMSVLSTSLPVR